MKIIYSFSMQMIPNDLHLHSIN